MTTTRYEPLLPGEVAELNLLREQSATIHARINELEDKRRAAEQAKYVGRFFRYRNSYSCPESDADRWWTYSRVIADADGELRAFRFQTDKYGTVQIEEGALYTSTLGEEISREEYRKAVAALRASLMQTLNAHGKSA